MSINLEKLGEAIKFLRTALGKEDGTIQRIQSAIAEYGTGEWVHHLYDSEIENLTPEQKESGLASFYAAQGHFGFGMGVRNYLRNHGFGEKELEVDNLDDYYVAMVEEAVNPPTI